MNSVVIGVDSSTQSTKVEARDLETGALVASGSSPHPPTTPPVSEQDPQAWWEALVAATAELGVVAERAVAISVAGQQHGLVLLDEADEVIRPAKLWNDTTSSGQATALVEALGQTTWAKGCGSVPVASFTVSKLAWMAEHEPHLLQRTAKVMLPHDYLTWRLTGRHVTDRGDASGTGWFDPAFDTYRAELLEAAVGDPFPWTERLPTVLGPVEASGELTSVAAAELGLPAGITVGAGTGDNMAAALGLGLRPGDVAMSLGTSGTVYAVSATGTADPTGTVAGFADASGGFLPLVCTLNATGVTDVVARWLGTDAPGLSELAMSATASDAPLVLLPYFDGERTPNLPEASGSFHGLRRSTTREQLAQAAHDGVLCGLLEGLDALVSAGVDTSGAVKLIGGGARAAAYQQRGADLRGQPIIVPDTDEVVAAGAAVQAAATLTGTEPTSLAPTWGLGAGLLVEPQEDGSAVRAAYQAESLAYRTRWN